MLSQSKFSGEGFFVVEVFVFHQTLFQASQERTWFKHLPPKMHLVTIVARAKQRSSKGMKFSSFQLFCYLSKQQICQDQQFDGLL